MIKCSTIKCSCAILNKVKMTFLNYHSGQMGSNNKLCKKMKMKMKNRNESVNVNLARSPSSLFYFI